MGQDARGRRRNGRRAGVVSGQVGGAGVDECGRRGGLAGRQARGQQCADDTGQHITGSGSGRPRLACGVEVHPAPGFGDDGDIALEQDGDAELIGQPAGGCRRGPRLAPIPASARTHRRAGSGPSGLRGRRRAQGARREWSARRRRPARARRSPSAKHSAAAAVSSVPSPGPTTQACTRPALRVAGRGDHFRPVRKHLLPSTSRVADHAGGGGHRGAGAQHRGTRIGRRAGHHAGDTLAVLVVLRARAPASVRRRRRRRVPTSRLGCRSSPMSTSSTRPQSPSA